MSIAKSTVALLVLALGSMTLAQTRPAISDDFEQIHRTMAAKNPPDVTYEIATSDGQAQYHMGQTITLMLNFSTTVERKYRIYRGLEKPTIFKVSDIFHVDPSAGGADPMASYPWPPPTRGAVNGGGPTVMLWTRPLALSVELNDHWRFDKPGKYRIFLESPRLLGPDAPRGMVLPTDSASTIASNILQLDILPPDSEWGDFQFAQAKQVFENPNSAESLRLSTIHTLKNLQTEDAAHLMLAQLSQMTFDPPISTHLRDALYESCYRDLVVGELKRLADNPQTARPEIVDALWTMTANQN